MLDRLAEIGTGLKTIASACSPRLLKWRVSYFNKDHVWTGTEVKAYTRTGAVAKVSELSGIKLRAGHSCFVLRVFGD